MWLNKEAMKKFAHICYESWKRLPRWLGMGILFVAIDILFFIIVFLLHLESLWEIMHLPFFIILIPLSELIFWAIPISGLAYDLILGLIGAFALGVIIGATKRRWKKKLVVAALIVVIAIGLVFSLFSPFLCIRVMDVICTIIPDFEAAGFACIPFAAFLDDMPSALPAIRRGVGNKMMTDMCRKLLMEFLENDMKSTPILIKIVADKSESEFVRDYAIFTLGLINDPRAVDVLIGLLEDQNKELQVAAAGALSRISEIPEDVRTRIAAPLIRMLTERAEGDVGRRGIIEALGNIRARSSIGYLIPLLDDPDWCIRSDTAKALGKIGDQRALTPLKEAFAVEKDEWTKIEIAIAAAKFGDNESFEFLLDELKRSKYHKDIIARGLGEIGNPKATEPLLSEYQLHKKETSPMYNHINVLIGRALIMLGSPKGIRIVKRYLKGCDLYIMEIARDTLHNKEKWLAREKKE